MSTRRRLLERRESIEKERSQGNAAAWMRVKPRDRDPGDREMRAWTARGSSQGGEEPSAVIPSTSMKQEAEIPSSAKQRHTPAAV